MSAVPEQSATPGLANAAAYLMQYSDVPGLFERLMKLVSQDLQSVVVRVDYQQEGQNHVRLAHADGTTEPTARRYNDRYLGPLANSALLGEFSSATARRCENEDGQLSLLCTPVLKAQRVLGAVSIVTPFQDQHRLDLMLSRLDSFAALASAACVDRETANRESAAAAQTKGLAETSHFESPDEFAYSLVNQLCSQLKAESVSLGIEHGDQVRVLAVSGIAEIKSKTPGVSALSQLMEECLDHGEMVVAQSASIEGINTLPIHRQHSTEHQSAAVCSIPLVQKDQISGVVTVRRSANMPFTKDQLDHLAKALGPYGNAIKVLEKANRSLPRHFFDSSKTAVRNNIKAWRLFWLAAVGLLIGWLCLGTLPYRPLCETRVIAADLRHFSAPFGGKLQHVLVEPGQFVEEGELLAEFDTVELRLERNSLTREIQAKEIEKKYALSGGELPKAALYRAQVQALQARLGSVEQQINEAKIIAPVAGNVMIADLQQRIGEVFQQGDEVLQIAPKGDWMLEIKVPDDIISYVTPSQVGSFATSALPTERKPFAIEHIDGAAQVIDDRNVFVARGRLKDHPEWMRSGMEGTARIEAERRPVWWVCFHTAIDWVRTNFWL